MSEMQNTDVVGVPTMEGSEDQILAALWSLCYDAMRGVDCGDVLDAIRHIQEGNRAVQVAGEQFVVTDPEWSVEQDFFGCEKGRGCTDVTDEQRVRFAVLIAARTQAEAEKPNQGGANAS